MSERQVVDQPADLTDLLEHWVAEGLITRVQAERIMTSERLRSAQAKLPIQSAPTAGVTPAPGRPARVSLVTEALGYLGGVLILVATALIVARYWRELPLGARLGLAVIAATLLLMAGSAVPPRLGTAGRRLHAVLWALSTGAFAGFLALLAADLFDWTQGEDVGLFTAGGTAVYACVLWVSNRSGLQLAVMFGALAATAATVASRLEGPDGAAPGLAVWGLSLMWLVVAWRGLLQPQHLAYILGSVGALFGAQATTTTGWGYALALATTAALVIAAVVVGDLIVLGIGAVGMLMVLPGAVDYFFPGALAAPIALLAGGVLLVAAALRTARRQGRGATKDRSP